VASDPEMKVRTIGEQGGIRLVVAGVVDEFSVLAVDARKMPNNLSKPNHSKARSIDDRADAGVL
jgi:hypothetical protein